jgi:hypothetical protein
MGDVINISMRDGEDIADWLRRVADQFDVVIGDDNNPYRTAENEIKALRNAVTKSNT